MEVKKISPQGYCYGVKNALNIVKSVVTDPNTLKPIYILGNIIHNKNVVNQLSDYGIITIKENGRTRNEMLEDVKEGTLIFTAHGVCPSVREKALNKGLHIIDASCKNVLLIQQKIGEKLKEGYQIFYIGTKGHPECEGVLGISPSIILIDSTSLILPKTKEKKIYITNQTTLSCFDIKDFYKEFKAMYPNAIIDDKICGATSARQLALVQQKDCDLCIIVGDKLSSNSKKLVDVCQKYGHIKSILIESLKDLKEYDLTSYKNVSVSAGASTPDYLVEEVINYLNRL